MTDAEKREKVIRGLECHFTKGFVACKDCPYYPDELIYEDDDDMEGTICEEKLAADALVLLKEQEARVMTKEEVLATPEGVVVWMEENSESGTYIQPIVSTGNGCLGNFYIGVGAYGVEMRERRFWTSRPSPEQMRDTPWKDAENEEP